MKLLQAPPTGIKLLLAYVVFMSLFKIAGFIDPSWKWILIPLGILLGIYVIAFIAGLIVGVKGHEKRVQFWERFYSRKPDQEEDLTKWL